ncbi:lysocardiolipin acyltransferase [Fructobacillus pseudoficulneus]|uniref:Lysocardiolipin acyltransferase n=1 Tax=Fructobacillus pseudoficulneus TaxID=220714 RepID=A0A3F3GSC2_9LACO|nr:hypothetical protein [Fructobacillus pseudoficulneus]GAP02521.1 lysocardiolipin acyltransferase [Fructobacillus pseudoficulneus]SEH37380.1 hypothetical protein SAMN05660469_0472 [Fructobacillus pseudoficulneus]
MIFFGLILVIWGIYLIFRGALRIVPYILLALGFVMIVLFFLSHWLLTLLILAIIMYFVHTGRQRNEAFRNQYRQAGFGANSDSDTNRRDISDEAEQSDSK